MASDYKFTGYGIMSKGSSVKMFEGTDQQLFLGGKNAQMVGISNTFTFGVKSDVMVGASVNLGFAPFEWENPLIPYTGHATAKYDFSSNKNFAFQISPEGSSNYVTQSKFNCEQGFQAVGGFQTFGGSVYSSYKKALYYMGLVVALTNFVSSLAIVYKTFPEPEKNDKGEMGKGDLTFKDDQGKLKDDDTLQNFAQTSAWAATGTSTGIATLAAIIAAITRETKFKPWIHPQSVIDLKPQHVFLGALGDATIKREGASLLLKNGRATLGAREFLPFSPLAPAKPYADKFGDFAKEPTTLLEIAPTSIACSATNVITIEAGDRQSVDPALKGLEVAQRATKLLQDAKTIAGQEAYDLAMLNPTNLKDPLALTDSADIAKKSAEASLEAGVIAAQAQEKAAEAFYKLNPSLYLSAGGTTSLLAAIEAKAPNFNVIAKSISLSDTDIPIRGLFVKQTPPIVQLVQTPTVSEILMGSAGTTIKFGVSEIQLKPAEIVIQNGTGSISVKATGLTIKVGTAAIELSPVAVNVGKGRLKVIAL